MDRRGDPAPLDAEQVVDDKAITARENQMANVITKRPANVIEAARDAACAAGRRLRRRIEAGGETAGDRRYARNAAAATDTRRQWECDCGQRYRIVGESRHRIYWRHDADAGDPMMEAICASCDRPLPA